MNVSRKGEHMSFSDRLKTHIVQSYLDGESSAFDHETPLLDLNIISSADIFDLVQFIRTEEQIELPLEEISPENFQSVQAITLMIGRLRGAEPAQDEAEGSAVAGSC